MKKNNYDKIFNKSDCVSEELLLKYINKQATPQEQHYIEYHSMSCDMCSDIIEGLLLQKNEQIDVEVNIEELDERIDIRLKTGSRQKPPWYLLAVAASIALLIGVGIYIFNIPQLQLAENILSKTEEPEAVVDQTKDTLTSEAPEPEINKQEEKWVDKKPITKPIPPKVVGDKMDEAENVKGMEALLGSGNAGQGSANMQQYSAPVFEKDNTTTGGAVTSEDINTMEIRDVSGIASSATSGDNYVNEDSLAIEPKQTNNENSGLLANEVTPKYNHTRGSRSDNSEILLSEPSLITKSKRTSQKEAATEAAVNADINPAWPFVIVGDANAFILETSLSALNFNEISKAIKAKSISVSPDKLAVILNKIQSTTFTSGKSASAISWKYVVLLRNNAQKEVAYIALSEDEKTIMRFPDEGYSNDQGLINIVKSQLQ